MIVDRDGLKNYNRGWLVGDFSPSLIRSKDIEVGYMNHKKGEFHAPHIHNVITEFNVIISGSVHVNGYDLKSGDIFIIEPGEITRIEFLEDTTILCIKTPSIPGDKHII